MHNKSLTYKLLAILLCWIGFLAAQPVTITGVAPFAKNEEIRLLVFNDLINNVPTVAATDKIDKNGHFKLSCTINEIKLCQLAIRTTKAEFLLVPHFRYDFEISTDTVLFQLINPEHYGGYLEITSTKTDTNDLNYKINRFTNYFNKAMNYYGFKITYDHDIAYYDTLTDLLHKHFDFRYNPDNFYHSYLYYTCGMLDRVCFPKDFLRIYREYFDNDRILYNNPAYMMLFNENYAGYLYNSRYISKDLLTEAINEEPDYLKLFNDLGRDPQLVNERIRELVIIKNLIELYGNEEFDKGNIVKLLQYIRVSTHFPDHIPFVENALRKFAVGQETEHELNFKNPKGKKFVLKQFNGKPIYVQVFQSDCLDCIREMMILKELVKEYGEEIQFLSINVDPAPSTFEQFHKNYGEMFDWPMVHFNGAYQWLLENEIETLPDHFIMNEDGNITNRYVPAPEQNLIEYLQIRYSKETIKNDNPLFRNQ